MEEWGRGMSRQRQAEMRGEEIRGRGRIGLSIVFWNVTRLQNKDRKFWRGLDRGDIVVLSETWWRKRIRRKRQTAGEI